jgi:hypothetical protein
MRSCRPWTKNARLQHISGLTTVDKKAMVQGDAHGHVHQHAVRTTLVETLFNGNHLAQQFLLSVAVFEARDMSSSGFTLHAPIHLNMCMSLPPTAAARLTGGSLAIGTVYSTPPTNGW